MRPLLCAAAAAFALALAGSAAAATLHFHANLTAAQETPPTTSAGTGTATVDLNTADRMLSWKVTYQGLSGPPTAAHFHGPAKPGKAAGVQVPLTGPLASPISGSAKITASQERQLRAGDWYVNVHTAQNPGGEIRGQVLSGK
ncbi:MAG: CHRD domain-containing protein [Caulobacteraceae bacterium]